MRSGTSSSGRRPPTRLRAGGSRPLPAEVDLALAELAPDHRAVIVLRYLLSTHRRDRLAADVPRGTVNSRLRRGLDALGTRLGEEASS